jgi:hypothetical protein
MKEENQTRLKNFLTRLIMEKCNIQSSFRLLGKDQNRERRLYADRLNQLSGLISRIGRLQINVTPNKLFRS